MCRDLDNICTSIFSIFSIIRTFCIAFLRKFSSSYSLLVWNILLALGILRHVNSIYVRGYLVLDFIERLISTACYFVTTFFF